MKLKNEHIVVIMFLVCVGLLGYFIFLVVELFDYDVSVLRFCFDRFDAPLLPRHW